MSTSPFQRLELWFAYEVSSKRLLNWKLGTQLLDPITEKWVDPEDSELTDGLDMFCMDYLVETFLLKA